MGSTESQKLQSPLVSVIILNYNGRTALVKSIFETCLASVFENDYTNFEVLFVDNGSSDDSIDFVHKKFGNDQRLKIIENGKNLGFAEGNNAALPYVKGKYLLFLNNDAIVDRGFLKELVETMESDGTIGVCGCKESRGSVGMCCDIYGFPIPRFNASEKIFYVPGWALLTRHEIISKIGAFDSKYFSFVEDFDLCWRVLLAGYQIVVNPNAVAYHFGGGTLKAEGITDSELGMELHFSVKRISFFERNMIRTLLKNYSTGKLLSILPRYFSLFLIESFVFLFLGGVSTFQDIYVRAIRWNIQNFRDTWLLHAEIQQMRKVNDDIIQKSMLKGNTRIQYYKKLLQKGVPKLVYKK